MSFRAISISGDGMEDEEEATDVMVNGGKELLELAWAVPQASKGGLERLSLRFTTVVRLDARCRQVPLPQRTDRYIAERV